MVGIPRQVYADVSAYNQLIPVEPKANHIYPIGPAIPIQISASDEVGYVRYALNDSDWKYLEGSGHGSFQGFFKLPKLAKKRQTLDFQALDKNEVPLAKKEVSFLAGVLQETVTIEPKTSAKGTKSLDFTVRLEDSLHHSIPKRKIYYGCFYSQSFHEGQGVLLTNESGQIAFSCPATPEPRDQYVLVAAGTDSPEHQRSSDMRIFKLGR